MAESPNAELIRIIRKLADEIIVATKKPVQNAPRFKVAWGIITSVDDSPREGVVLWPTVSVRVGGNTINNVTNARYLASYSPVAGDKVLCLWYGRDFFVIGGLSGDVRGALANAWTDQIPATVGQGDVFSWPVDVGNSAQYLINVSGTLSLLSDEYSAITCYAYLTADTSDNYIGGGAFHANPIANIVTGSPGSSPVIPFSLNAIYQPGDLEGHQIIINVVCTGSDDPDATFTPMFQYSILGV